jgi:hypothetical protein
MRKQQQVAILHFAPRARVAVAQFHEINRPIKFRAPFKWLNLAHVRIDLHKRTGPQQWREGVVL